MKIKHWIVVSVLFVASFVYSGFQDSNQYAPYSKRLSLRAVENQTKHSLFKMFYAGSDSLGLLYPQSVFLLKPEELLLQHNEIFSIQCVKGSFLTIYVKDEGKVSGQVPEGFYGPFYLSMWLNYPDVSEDQKIYVRYAIKIGKQAECAIRINSEGDCQIIALSNMQLLP